MSWDGRGYVGRGQGKGRWGVDGLGVINGADEVAGGMGGSLVGGCGRREVLGRIVGVVCEFGMGFGRRAWTRTEMRLM